MAEQKTRILVVEDDVIVASDIEKTLENFGYKVPATAASGEDAVKKALEIKPDLILMDIRLKGEMDGVEAARRIREKISVPVIYLTAYSDDKTIERAKITEPLAYLLKPFEERELKTAVEIALYRHKTEEKVRALKEFNENVIRSIPLGIVVVDLDKRITAMNSAQEELFGLSKNHFIGSQFKEAYVPRFLRTVENMLDKSLRDGKTSFESNIAYSDEAAGNRMVDLTISPLLDRGRITGAVIVSKDVSEKRRMKEKIRLLEKKDLMLTDRDKLVLYGLVRYPEANDVGLARKLRLKRTTLTSIKNKLKKMGFYSTVIVPDLDALGFELLKIEFGGMSSVNADLLDKPFKEKCGSPDCFNAVLSPDEYYVISAARDISSSLDMINSGSEGSTTRMYFPLGVSSIECLFDYADFIKNYLKIDFKDSGVEKKKGPRLEKRRFSKNEAKVLYALSKYPDFSDKKISGKTSLSTVAVGQIRRRLSQEKAYTLRVIPNMKKLGCDVLVLAYGRFNPGGRTEGLSGFMHSVFSVRNEKNVFSLTPFRNLAEYAAALEGAKSSGAMKNMSSLKTDLISVDKIKFNRLDFSPLIAEALDVEDV